MNKLFLTSTEFRNNRLFPQTASPRRYISLMLLSAFLIGAVLLLVPRTMLLESKNKTLSNTLATLEDSLKKTDKEKEALKDTLEGYRREKESIQFQLQKIQDDLNAVTEEKTYLEEILINKTKEMEALKQTPRASAVPAVSAARVTGGGTEQLKAKDEEIRKLYEQNTLLSQKLDRLYKTTSSKIMEINVAKIALEDTIVQTRKTIDNEWNLPAGQAGTVNLGSIQVHQANANISSKEKTQEAPRAVSKKQGKVLAINEDYGFVVVDLGKVDGIKNDSILVLKRNNDVIATLTVLEIRDVMTACNIKNLNDPGKKIAVNDLVSVLK